MKKESSLDINALIERSCKKYPDIDKEKVEQLIHGSLEEGLAPKEIMKVTDELIDYTYSTAYQYYQNGKFEEAIKLFSLLDSLVPTEITYKKGLAYCYERLKKYDDALAYYAQCLAIDIDDPTPYWHMHKLFLQQDEKELALVALHAIIGVGVDEPEYADLVEKTMNTIEKINTSIVEEKTAKKKVKKKKIKKKEAS